MPSQSLRIVFKSSPQELWAVVRKVLPMPALGPAAGSAGWHTWVCRPSGCMGLRHTYAYHFLRGGGMGKQMCHLQDTLLPCLWADAAAIKFSIKLFKRQSLRCEIFMQTMQKLWRMWLCVCLCSPSHFGWYALIGCLALVYWTGWRTHPEPCFHCQGSVLPLTYSPTRGVVFGLFCLVFSLSYFFLYSVLSITVEVTLISICQEIIWR